MDELTDDELKAERRKMVLLSNIAQEAGFKDAEVYLFDVLRVINYEMSRRVISE